MEPSPVGLPSNCVSSTFSSDIDYSQPGGFDGLRLVVNAGAVASLPLRNS
jgi:hypothetical protein